MENTAIQNSPGLAKGQLWKNSKGFITIVELGRKSVLFRMFNRKEQSFSLTRILRRDAFQVYLRATAATLVN